MRERGERKRKRIKERENEIERACRLMFEIPIFEREGERERMRRREGEEENQVWDIVKGRRKMGT